MTSDTLIERVAREVAYITQCSGVSPCETCTDIARAAVEVMLQPKSVDCLLLGGERVEKVGGDYRFSGVVVAAFQKRGGLRRVVVENGDGVLHIFNPAQLRRADDV